MDKPRARVMDVAAPRRPAPSLPQKSVSRRQLLIGAGSIFLICALLIGWHWYQHRNDQAIVRNQYQIVYLLTGKIYFGKLQNTDGQYLTLKDAYTVEDQTSSSSSAQATATSGASKILKVSQQVYGPDDTIAIRADQIQFWQNLRADSKVTQAIASADKQP